MSNPSQLYLLADHIKLSLLERQRAISLNLEPNSQDGHISRSLDSMREGVEGLEQSGDDEDQARRLREQFDDLTSQFQGFPGNTTTSTVVQPNDPALSSDFEHAKDTRPRIPSSSSFMKKSNGDSPNMSKSVRFRDSPPDPEEEANRAALFPYRDEPEDPPDQSELDNQQVHAYHKQVLRDQDDQLDRLGESIGRQRDLSIQMYEFLPHRAASG